MVSPNDPIESFFNSIHVVKEAISPLELGIRKATKGFEACWSVHKHRGSCSVGLSSSLKDCCGDGDRSDKSGKFQTPADEKKKKNKGLSIKVPIEGFWGLFLPNSGRGNRMEVSKSRGLKESDSDNGNGSCDWSVLVDGFVQVLPTPFRGAKKQVQRTAIEDKACLCSESKVSSRLKQRESRNQCVKGTQYEGIGHKEGKQLSLECCIGFIFDQLNYNLQKFAQEHIHNNLSPSQPVPSTRFDHWGVVSGILEGQKAEINGFLRGLSFARVRGVPSSIVGVSSSVNEEGDDGVAGQSGEETGGASGILLANVAVTEVIELVPEVGRSSKDHPDKKKLFSVQDFFRYTESEGRRFFQELDKDGDGQVTIQDLEAEMRKRKLPQRYAREFMSRARAHLFSRSFGWKQFMSMMEQKELTILRAYTSLCPSESGTLRKSGILASLKNSGLPANEDNAVAMMLFLNPDSEESVSYGDFRNFMFLLPNERLQDDPRNILYEAATAVPVAQPVQLPRGSLLKSALAGGLSCAFSAAIMHPVDTIKTQVQASTVLSFVEIMSKLPEIGLQGLYRGSIPAIVGQFTSHGLRTGIHEASKAVLINVAPTLPDIQVQSLASFCATVLGTTFRVPCEVLKQRCQAGLYDNVGDALIGTWQQDGLQGFFRGTVFTLFREVPFYVAGMALYAESKKLARHLLGRELEPWETITVGALSGGLAAVTTTPFDVMKTRMMTAPHGQPMSMQMAAFSILSHEGPLGLFKGVVPRFFWIAPLGAMNFAGYELLRKAMDGNVEPELPQK